MLFFGRWEVAELAEIAWLFVSSRTLNRWIVFVDEVALDQLDGQAGFAHTTTADHNELVLSEKL